MKEDRDPRIPDPVKKTPRCPLCHAHFVRERNEAKVQHLEQMVAEAVERCKTCDRENDKRGLRKAKRWLEILSASIKAGAADIFACHFCKIGIACNDPFVGRWEEAYAKGEKIFCPACEHEMRFFCTSTGFMLAACPVKKCQSRMQLSAPDRQAGGAAIADAQGNAIALPNIDRAISTPEDMTDGQVGGSGKDEALPDVTTLLPKIGGNA